MSAVAFVLVIVATVITTTTRAHLLDQVDNRLASIGNPGPGLGLDAAEQLSREPDLPERFRDIPERVSDMYMGVLRTDDELVTVFASNLGGGDLSIPDIDPDAARDAAASQELFTAGSLDDGLRYRVSAREVPDGSVFVTALPLSDVDDAVARLVAVEAIATTVILAALGLVTWWVLRLGIRPIKRMTDVASSIAGGDLSHRVPESASSTEAGQLGVALNQMLGRIEDAFDVRAQSEDRLRQFVADASHELRTPVTTIRGYAELFRSGGLGEPRELEEAMRRTEQEAIRMGRLVDDMLTLAKLDQDRPLETRSVDLAVLMSDAARDAAAVDPCRSICTDIEASVVVTGDEDRLRQVLANVVGNALVHRRRNHRRDRDWRDRRSIPGRTRRSSPTYRRPALVVRVPRTPTHPIEDHKMTATTRPKLRWILLVSLSIALTAAAAEAIARWAGTGVEPTIVAAPVLETVTVTVGDLTSTERIDGTIEETQSITVLHRIEGQSSASTPTQPSATDSATDASAESNVSPVGLASFASSVNAIQADTFSVDAAPVPECPPVDQPTTTTTTTTAPGVTIPVDDECDPTPTTTPDTTTPDTTPTTIPTAGSEPEPTGDSGRVGSTPGGLGGPSSRQGTTSDGTTTSSEPVTQMITSIAAIGSPIANGDVIYTVDGQPVVALHGTQPAWRTLESGVDDGPDVLQLEQSLVDLGYDPDATVTIDDSFDSDTEAAIERWQEGLAVDPTGAVELGSVVFVAADTTITAHLAAVGDAATDGTAIVSLSGSSHHVVIEVPTELQTVVTPGLDVDIAGTAGVVTVLRSAERDSTTVVQALITPTEPLDDATGTVVTVRLDITSAIGATIVPAEALVSRLDGTYAVQVGSPDGPHEFLPVTVLAVSGGHVAVQSDQLDVGMTILVPV